MDAILGSRTTARCNSASAMPFPFDESGISKSRVHLLFCRVSQLLTRHDQRCRLLDKRLRLGVERFCVYQAGAKVGMVSLRPPIGIDAIHNINIGLLPEVGTVVCSSHTAR
jgi:hypothetical protein